MKGIHIKPPTARVLAKLKKGMKCRVCPCMSGKGAYMEVHPERFNHVTRSFTRGKGIHIQLSPEEIAHNHGKGIFDDMKSLANSVNDRIIQPAVKAITPVAEQAGKTLLPLAKQAGNALIDYGVDYAPELATSALTGLALATGQPELLPLAGLAGQYLGKAGGKKLGEIAKKKVSEFNPYGEDKDEDVYVPQSSSKEPPSRGPKREKRTKIINYNYYNPYEGMGEVNQYTGQKMGNIQKANIESYLANLSLSEVEALLNKKRQSPLDYSGGKAVLSPYADPVGRGLYAGKGMVSGGAVRKQRPRREMSSIGVHGNLLGAHLPPALVSQPYSANFQFGSRLPPAYQKFAHSGMGLYA